MAKRWKPKQGQKYFFISEQKGIIWDYFDIHNSNAKSRYYIGNCYKTRDKASAEFNDIVNKLTWFYETTGETDND